MHSLGMFWESLDFLQRQIREHFQSRVVHMTVGLRDPRRWRNTHPAGSYWCALPPRASSQQKAGLGTPDGVGIGSVRRLVSFCR